MLIEDVIVTNNGPLSQLQKMNISRDYLLSAHYATNETFHLPSTMGILTSSHNYYEGSTNSF